MGLQIGIGRMEKVWRFLKKKSRIELLHDPAIPLLSIEVKNMKILSRNSCVHCSIFTIDKISKQHKCPSMGELLMKM